MEAIAARAGVSKITLYRNWSGRGPILAEAFLHSIQERLPLDPGADPRDALKKHLLRFGVELNGPFGARMREIIAEFLGDPALMKEFRDHYIGQRRETAVALIRRGISLGQFHARGDPVSLHDELYGAVFYRFLFGFGQLGRKDLIALFDHVLEPAADRADTARP